MKEKNMHVGAWETKLKQIIV